MCRYKTHYYLCHLLHFKQLLLGLGKLLSHLIFLNSTKIGKWNQNVRNASPNNHLLLMKLMIMFINLFIIWNWQTLSQVFFFLKSQQIWSWSSLNNIIIYNYGTSKTDPFSFQMTNLRNGTNHCRDTCPYFSYFLLLHHRSSCQPHYKKKPTVVTMLRTAICLGEQNGRILPTIPPPALW